MSAKKMLLDKAAGMNKAKYKGNEPKMIILRDLFELMSSMDDTSKSGLAAPFAWSGNLKLMLITDLDKEPIKT